MTRRALAACALLVALASRPLPVVADAGTNAILHEAGSALVGGDYARAATLSGPLTTAPGIDRADRSEAWRIYGLALFHAGRTAEAEAAVLEHLKLEPDAHLDPAVFPPEVIVFFEDVRARHPEIAASRNLRPDTPLEKAKNWFPPWGQLQNRQRGKAIFIGATGLVLLTANIVSAALLYRWCDETTGVCSAGSHSRRDQAILMRRVNLVTVPALVGLYVYGVIDGYAHMNTGHTERSYISLGVDPSGGGMMVVGGSF